MEPTDTPSADQLETFPNPRPGRDFTLEIVCPEFTSVCPKTGQPDFGTITFTYTPGEKCVELKSLKLYLQRYRNRGIFYEAVTNQLLDDFVAACRPVRCKVVSAWTPRGGITKVIEAVRQLRCEAHPKVQVANCDLALAHGTGGSLGTRHGAATLIMEREG